MNAMEQRAAKLRAQQRADHDEWTRQQAEEQSRQTAANDTARVRYLSRLADEKAAKQKEFDAALDTEFEPQKKILMRTWLIDNPGKTESDFERLAWQHHRENLIAERSQKIQEATAAQMRATGRYSL